MLLRWACALGAAAVLPSAGAASSTATLAVSSQVALACAIAVDRVDFGEIPAVRSVNVDRVGAVRVECTSGVPWQIGMSLGSHRSGNQRRMSHVALGGVWLDYELYRDAAYSQVWRDTPPTRVQGVGMGTVQTVSLYSRLPANQTPPVGMYIDTVTATIRY